MTRPRPTLERLCDLTPGQYADCFALLAHKFKGVTREGKAYYACRFRDNRRTVAFMAWGDGPWFGPCENDWQPGQFYKLRGVYGEHERYGPQFTELGETAPVRSHVARSTRMRAGTKFRTVKASARSLNETSRTLDTMCGV